VSVDLNLADGTNNGTLQFVDRSHIYTYDAFTNNGTITLAGGTNLDVVQGTFTNDGTIDVDRGAEVLGTITGNAPRLASFRCKTRGALPVSL
jgi:hypothetical protein